MDISEDFLRKKRKEEYQYQHFELTTSIFKTEVKEMVMSIVEKTAEEMANRLTDKYPAKNDGIKLATRNLIEEYANKTEEFVTSIEDKIDNTFFGIPSYVLLPEDKPQIKQYSKEYVRQVKQDLEKLEKKILQVKFMEAKLKDAVRLSERALKSYSNLPANSSSGKPVKYYHEGLDKLKSDMVKVNKGRSYISDKLMDYSTSDKKSSIKPKIQTVEPCFKLLVD